MTVGSANAELATGEMAEAVAVEDDEILKPPTEKREYRRIVLKNSMEVLLISDSDTEKCAASMNVRVGSFSDPDGLEGLAHFLEHMLFYASEKYPKEDSYEKYISEHGGSTNAYTSSDITNYYFDINTNSFDEALDRFAQFFIKPLMSPDAVMREIKAVDSENQKNLLSDSWRVSQLQRHLSREDHPYHRFSTGSMDTLHIRPQAKGINIRSELMKFYDEHYSANLMHLVVYGKENLDKLQGLVEEKFQEIRNTNKGIPRFSGHPCTPDHLQVLVKVVPVVQCHEITVSWPLNPNIHQNGKDACNYLSHVISHEGERSLFHALKTVGWTTGLDATVADWTMDISFFSVRIVLTDAGHEHMQDIIGLLFKYIKIVQQSGVCEWFFDELVAISHAEFHNRDKISPISYAMNLSSHMMRYMPKHWLGGSSESPKFNPAIVHEVLDELSPSNVRIFWVSNKFEGQTNEVEPWYGTAYSLEKITTCTIQKWVQSAPDVNQVLPKPNVFIPTDFSLKNTKEKDIVPVLVRKTPFSSLWYKPDTTFFKPKAFVTMNFNCPLTFSSPDAAVLTNLFLWLLVDYLNETAYYAEVAGLTYELNISKNGFELNLFGFNHKLGILLEDIIQKIAKFEVKRERFSINKETMTKAYQNYKFQQPHEQATYYCAIVLQEISRPWTEHLDALYRSEAEDLSNFVPVLLSRTFVECYIAGNIDKNEAVSMVKYIEDVLFNGPRPICLPLSPSQFTTDRVTKLAEGMKYFYHQEGLNSSDENSALVHYIQCHQDETFLNVKLQLFHLVAKQPAYHQLRTIEQLGYITSLSLRKQYSNNSGVCGLRFVIQSSVKGPGHIDSRVESLLKDLEIKLYEMTDDEFKSNVTALINAKLEKHKNLDEESWCYWAEIQAGTLKFNRQEVEVAALKELKKEELIDFFNEYIKVDAPKKKSLSICIYANQHLEEMASDKEKVRSSSSFIEIEDIIDFRNSQPCYRSLNV